MSEPRSKLSVWQRWLLPLALAAVFLAVRLPALGRFVTTDEALWLRRSANFYLAVSQGDWAQTFQSPHPGVVTQWAGAAGYQLVFPQYAQVGQPQIHDEQLLRLMENRGVNPMRVLAAGRAVLVLIHALAFLAAWPFARRLLGEKAAALGLALLALDPFVAAHQRLLHLDGLLASFMLLSALAYIDFLQRRKPWALVVSALAAGLAWLTKTPSWFLLPAMLAATAYALWKSPTTERRALWLAPIAWTAIALLLVFALFPAMWQAPRQISQTMAGYALGSAEGDFSGPAFFNGVVYPDGELGSAGWAFYPVNLLWRSTPLTLIGLVLGLYFAFKALLAKNKATNRPVDQPASYFGLLLFAGGFLLFMTLAGKKFDRYLLPALPPLILLAGWGWVRLAASWAWLRQTWRQLALLAAVVALQGLSLAPTYPYCLSYYDPLLGGIPAAPQTLMVGWGEGLDQAAGYLNHQPDIAQAKVASWYSVSFNLMFSYQAADIPITQQLPPDQLNDLLASDYLVIYIHQWQRDLPANLLDALAGLQPEAVFTQNGIEYARVYHLTAN